MSQWGEIRAFNRIEFLCSIKTNAFDKATLSNIVDWITIAKCPGDIQEIDKMLYFHLIEKEFLNKPYEDWLKFDLTNLKELFKNEYKSLYEVF